MTLWVTNGQCRALILLMAAEKDIYGKRGQTQKAIEILCI